MNIYLEINHFVVEIAGWDQLLGPDHFLKHKFQSKIA